MSFVYQIRRDTAANWTAANPTLLQGEWALETDTDRVKMGDGTTAWNSLGYFTEEKANIASPALTGTPTAPTASAGTNTTQIATTAFVSTAVANVVNGATGALDTLNELATALNNDASYATTITNALATKAPSASPTFTGTVTTPLTTAGFVKSSSGGVLSSTSSVAQSEVTGLVGDLAAKAPLASPALTGTPTAPTPAAGTDSTQLATTAFVTSAIAAAAPGTGSITSDMIANGAIVDADVSSSASIAQSKIANLTSDLSAKAPLESPSLTGTPTAPTAASGTSTTQVATTAFVQGAVTDLIDGAPGALNTLNELAAALNDDASYASTITTALAAKAPSASPTFTGTVTTPLTTAGFVTTSGSGVLSSTAEVAQASVTGLVGDLAAKAPLESPALTGTPTAPTATGGTNTTQVATTAFVTAAVAAATPGTGSITSDMIANGSIVNEDISASAAIAQSKIDGLGASLDAKPDLFIADSTPGSLGSGDFWLDTSATI